MKEFISRIIDVYRPFKVTVFILFIFLIIGQALMLGGPYIYGKIIDGIIVKKSINEVLILAFVALFIYILHNVVLVYYRERFEVKNLDYDVRRYLSKKTLRKVLSYSIGQYHNENSGVKQSVIEDGEHSLAALTYTMLYEVFPLVLHVLLTIIALFWLSFVMGLIVFLGVVLFVIASLYTNYTLKDDLKTHEEMRHENRKIHTEILRNVTLVQINAQEDRALNEYDNSLGVFCDYGKKIWLRYFSLAALRNFIIGITRFAVIVVGVVYVYKGVYTPGYLVIFLTWSSNVFGRLGMVGNIHRQCMEMYVAVKKYFAMLDVKPEVEVASNPVRIDKIEGRIEFKNVSFKYPIRSYLEDDEVISLPKDNGYDTLSDISFIIEPGQKVAFVGSSGAGKTTLIHLITRAYDPDSGRVLIDREDLRLLDLKRHRESIGLVEQDVTLFDNTLRYNITFGLNGKSDEVTDDILDDVSTMSCIDKFHNRLEKGLDTIIGEKGIKLSGGERQRVGIARALIKEPEILIFDEATSNLDTENEALIRDSIGKASKGRTTIIIAHRLSTIKDVDKVFVFDKGRIVGKGKHSELAKNCDAYKKLIQNQMVTI